MSTPVFSPDSRFIAYFWGTDATHGAIKKIAVSGGTPVMLCDAGLPTGLSWDADDIVFSQLVSGDGGVMRVSANGGKPELLVPMKSGERAADPQILRNGQAALFTVAGDDVRTNGTFGRTSIVVQSLPSGARKTLIDSGFGARYLPTNHLVYAVGGTLFAVPFDLQQLRVTGSAAPMIDRIGLGFSGAALSVSDTGSLVYVSGSSAPLQGTIGLVDRKGVVERLKLPPRLYGFPRVAPDGKQVAFTSDDGKESIVWIYDLSGASAMRRLTFGGANRHPVWSSDGTRIAFQSDREGDLGIFWQRSDGTGAPERLTKADKGTVHIPTSWSSDGQTLAFTVVKGTEQAVWTFSLKSHATTIFASAPFAAVANAVFSPDGRWITYQSSETGRNEIFVRPFPTGSKYQISRDGDNHHPFWSPDGKDVFYVPGPGQFVAVSVTTQPTFTFGEPRPVPAPSLEGGPNSARSHDITRDGLRIVGFVGADEGKAGKIAAPQLQVVLNWFEELKQRVPSK